jgi:hypothetical protein
MRLRALMFLLTLSAAATAQTSAIDSDHDGLSDATEQALLERFRPHFMISSEDCSAQPAQFAPAIAMPTVIAEDGTIYGQAMLRAATKGHAAEIELHYYHLWRTDCGRLGHALDAEHVAVLLQTEKKRQSADDWHAAYWYAAAHEDTVCDASQITRAGTLDATTNGARVWISSGKHGSFLQEELCRRGCGGDRCAKTRELAVAAVVNLGEWNAPMNGAVWMSSRRWPLKDKITRSDFPAARIALLEELPDTDIAWATPARRPAEAAILGANSGIDGALTGASAAGGALAVTSQSTDVALSLASDKTGNAIGTVTHDTGTALGAAGRGTGHALRKTFHGVRKALGAAPAKPAAPPQQ